MSSDKSLTICSTLPVEVLSQIFSYLPYSDLKEARLVCYQWYVASQDKNLLDTETAVSCSEFNSIFQETLLRSSRDFLHLTIREDILFWYHAGIPEQCSIWYNTDFWARFGPKLRSLVVRRCNVKRNQFLHVLCYCSQLRLLDVKSCTSLFRPDSEKNSEKLALHLPKLLSFRIASLCNPDPELFDTIASSAPNLRELSLDECLDPVRMSLLQGLTCTHIQTYIKEKPHCMFDLHLRNIEGDDWDFIELVSMPNVRLRSLKIHFNLRFHRFYTDTVLNLVVTQERLEELELTCEVTDTLLLAICSTLENLKVLKLSFCPKLCDGIRSLCRLKKLTCLQMMTCKSVSNSAVVLGICSEVHTSLKSFTLTEATYLGEGGIAEVARYHPCLTYLDLSFCQGVTNVSIQAIFRYLVLLQHLKLVSCKNLDDSGISGEHLDSSTMLYPEAYSISRLTDLRELDLGGCSLDGSSFKSGLRMPNVRHVVLMSNDISTEAFKCFVQNNRTIENLDVELCQGINDDVLDAIGLNLLRLKILYIQGCKSVTKEGISLLRQRITNLKIK